MKVLCPVLTQGSYVVPLSYRLNEMRGNSIMATARPKSYVFTNRPNWAAKEVLGH